MITKIEKDEWEQGLDHFLPPLRKMAEAEVLHEKYFFEVLGQKPPERKVS